MTQIFRLLAGACWLLTASAWAGDIYIYQSSDGAHLITDHPRIENGYRLVRVYAQSNAWQATSETPRAVVHASPSHYDALIERAGRRHSVDPMLIKSVMQAESAFNPNAVSPKGASGLMQLMPATARRYGVTRLFDPRDNVMGGTSYLSDLLRRFDGNLKLALAGYNAGEHAVERSGGVPPYPETRHYVSKVLRLYGSYRADVCQRQVNDEVPVRGRIISCSAATRESGAGSTLGAARLQVSASDTASVDSAGEDRAGQWRMQ